MRNRRPGVGKLTFWLTFCLAAVTALRLAAGGAAIEQSPSRPAALSEAVLAKLPADWRQAAALVKATETDQQHYLKLTNEALRQTLARLLVRQRDAQAFVRAQLTRDSSPAVRSTILQAISTDPRWLAMPDTLTLIESVITVDPEATVSLAALDTMRRLRMRHLNAQLAARVAAARERGDDPKALTRLAEEQERWIALERGTMLPAFMRTPPAIFAVKPADAAVRVLAFGDFGNGSPEQKALATTIAAYHRDNPFDLAVTLGDNFYSVGMLSPADPRWQTWFEDLYGPLGITFYAALGNHDWGHPDSPASEVLYSAGTPTWKMPATYYTFTAGPVQFFALDTQTIAVSEKQRQWLDEELKRSRAPWKVAYGHHPIFSGGNYQDRPDLIATVLPILQNRADVYICGHDHNLQALSPEAGVHFYIAGGGGAGLYDLRPYERSIFASRSNGFAVIDGYQTRLRISLVDGTGKTIYEQTLQRAASSTESGR
jgi:hypothetical protein